MKNKKKICFTTIDDVIVEVNEGCLKVENNISEEEFDKMVSARTYQGVKSVEKSLEDFAILLDKVKKSLEGLEKKEDDMVLLGYTGEKESKFRKYGKIVALLIGAMTLGGIVGTILSYVMFKWFLFIGNVIG